MKLFNLYFGWLFFSINRHHSFSIEKAHKIDEKKLLFTTHYSISTEIIVFKRIDWVMYYSSNINMFGVIVTYVFSKNYLRDTRGNSE